MSIADTTMSVFYSWQSDLPPVRNYVEAALRKAVKRVMKATDDRTVFLDRDTQGVAGSPDVVLEILRKISATTAFVADVSIINRGSTNRLTPNPNVMFELGFALERLGHGRIILLFNGTHEEARALLPFDLGLKRALAFELPDDSALVPAARDALANDLVKAIQLIIDQEGGGTGVERLNHPSRGGQTAAEAARLLLRGSIAIRDAIARYRVPFVSVGEQQSVMPGFDPLKDLREVERRVFNKRWVHLASVRRELDPVILDAEVMIGPVTRSVVQQIDRHLSEILRMTSVELESKSRGTVNPNFERALEVLYAPSSFDTELRESFEAIDKELRPLIAGAITAQQAMGAPSVGGDAPQALLPTNGAVVRIHPAALRIDDDGAELATKDDDWLARAAENNAVQISNARTGHVLLVANESIKSFARDLNRPSAGLPKGILELKVQVVLKSSHAFITPLKPSLPSGGRLRG